MAGQPGRRVPRADRALVRRARESARRSRHALADGERSGAFQQGFHRIAHLDVGSGQLVAGEPLRPPERVLGRDVRRRFGSTNCCVTPSAILRATGFTKNGRGPDFTRAQISDTNKGGVSEPSA
jgi:hypothetical protein